VTQPYRPTLHRLPEATLGRFQVLREFLLQFHGLDTGTVGRTVDRVGEAEARLNKRLPLAVREWIALLDDLDRIGGWGQVLRDCWGLLKVPGCPAFSLLRAGEDDGHWGPLLRDLAKEDPPTSEFVLDYDDGKFKRVREAAPRVSTWATEFIIAYLRLSKSVQYERNISRPMLHKPREQFTFSQIGRTELIEFEGGLIHAEPEGGSYKLRCYAPYHGPADGYHTAAREFGQRVDALLGVTWI
jgi:hypothetical protein